MPPCLRCVERKTFESLKPSKKKRKLGNGKTWKPGNDSDDDEDDADETSLPGYGILKPDITFFGEKLSDAFDTPYSQIGKRSTCSSSWVPRSRSHPYPRF